MKVFDILQNLFYSLTTEEAILLAILGLLVFTLGLILGWIIQYGKTKRYKKQLLLLQQERSDYERLYLTTSEEQKALAKELETTSRQKVELMDRLQAVQAALNTKDAEIAELNEQVTALENQPVTTPDPVPEPEMIGTPSVVDPVPATDEPPSAPSAAEFQVYLDAIEARFQAYEDRLEELSVGQFVPPNDGFENYQAPIPQGEPMVIRADTAEPGVRYDKDGQPEVVVQGSPSLQVTIPELLDEPGDDLTRIKSISTFLQEKLNAVDIYRFEQIANWSEADINTYTELIGYVPGGIKMNDWVGQAQNLREQTAETPRPTTKTVAPDGDNLRVVEGIGPKIEGVLREAGVTDWRNLADRTPDELREILVTANKRYKSQNPETWPQQAALAAAGEWDKLSAWQQELKGGKLN